ncbi:hypothetical protein DPMN_029684 [Dreissena polymorpha]|uniref:Ig-like domain-containing protein n=1 Tax=Dreissena polymorpha TaxID=45954 RepID=A0A9D4LWV6_DREPO|nr:hypothetical protein DPMN_029684 [Dreissena polymorpha]
MYATMKPGCEELVVFFLTACCLQTVVSVKLESFSELIHGQPVNITCFVDGSFQFNFTNWSQDTINIGGCASPPTRNCFMSYLPMKMLYNITSTSDGGILTIFKWNMDHYGTYKCFDTFHPEKTSRIILPRETGGSYSYTICKSLLLMCLLAHRSTTWWK